MKILEVNTEKSWRGGERQTLYNALGLINLKHDVTLLCLKNFPLSEHAKKNGVKVIEIRNNLSAIFFMLFQAGKFDIIHTQTASNQFHALFSKLFFKIPIVYTRRVDFIPKGKITLLKYKSTDKVIAISNAIKNILKNFGVQNVEMISDVAIPKILNTERAKQFIQDNHYVGKKIIATTSAFVAHKDPITLVRTIHKLFLIRQDFVFLHFGSGILKQVVEEEIKKLNIQSCFILNGFVNDVEDYFSIMDIFVMSSEEEGLGSSVLDAFLYKVPVAVTKAGGMKEVVEGNGLLSEIKDPDALAQNINELLNNKDLRNTLTEVAYQYVIKNHSNESISLQYDRLFRRLKR
ncbi:MAG: glycosyltransferase family 4 protein [Bacteroidota bacterium]